MPINNKATPPPKIGKIGPYTVFVTPPATPKPSETVSESPKKIALSPVMAPPVKPSIQSASPPPVMAPPVRSSKSVSPASGGSSFGFFWNAVAKVQKAHLNLDDFVAHWFGLNQSKYQWALDDYYESKGADQEDGKDNDYSNKIQNV